MRNKGSIVLPFLLTGKQGIKKSMFYSKFAFYVKQMFACITQRKKWKCSRITLEDLCHKVVLIFENFGASGKDELVPWRCDSHVYWEQGKVTLTSLKICTFSVNLRSQTHIRPPIFWGGFDFLHPAYLQTGLRGLFRRLGTFDYHFAGKMQLVCDSSV